MKTPHDRLSSPYGALVEYGEYIQEPHPFNCHRKWASSLQHFSISPVEIGLSRPTGPIFVWAPSDNERIVARLTFAVERIHGSEDDYYGKTPAIAEHDGFWCYSMWKLLGLNIGSIPPDDILAFVTFSATDDQLPVVLEALSARCFGHNLRPGAKVAAYEDIDWGDTLKTMKRAA